MTKKNKLLESGKKLFAQQGFDKTSIREIAMDAGVNSAMISYHFGSKENMIAHIFKTYFPKISALPETNNPLLQLKALLMQIIELRIHDTELIDILHSEIILKSKRMADIQPYISPSWQELYNLLETCQTKKLIDVQSIDTAYMFLLAAISFPYHNTMFHPHFPLDETSIKTLIKMLMKGLNAHEISY